MKRILAATIGLASMIAAPAVAADLPAAPYKAPPPIRVFSWTGCYVGGNGGGLWARKEWTNTDPLFVPLGSYGTRNPSSWIAGAQAGCDYQSAGGFVAGIAGDYDWTDAKASNANALAILPPLTDQSRIKSLASITGRIGYAWDRFLGYVKGGGAWERDDYTVFFTTTGTAFATASEIRGGWTVGIGAEYAFTNWISGFVEYDYYNFGTRSNTLTCAAFAGCFGFLRDTSTFDVKETKNVFKAGLNFRWGPSPVVARY